MASPEEANHGIGGHTFNGLTPQDVACPRDPSRGRGGFNFHDPSAWPVLGDHLWKSVMDLPQPGTPGPGMAREAGCR